MPNIKINERKKSHQNINYKSPIFFFCLSLFFWHFNRNIIIISITYTVNGVEGGRRGP